MVKRAHAILRLHPEVLRRHVLLRRCEGPRGAGEGAQFRKRGEVHAWPRAREARLLRKETLAGRCAEAGAGKQIAFQGGEEKPRQRKACGRKNQETSASVKLAASARPAPSHCSFEIVSLLSRTPRSTAIAV